MATASINLPPYRALRSLDISEDVAASAAEALPAPSVDLSHLATRDDLTRFATRDELRAEISGVRTEIARAAQRQTIWLIGAMFTIAGLVVAGLRFFPAK